MASASRSGGKKKGGFFREEFGNPERRTAYLMILPTILVIFAIALFPVLYSVVLSLTDSTITGIGGFVGFENYAEMFQNPGFREGLYNTVVFTVVAVFFEFIIGLAIALAINRAFRGRGLVRAAILVPWAFPTVVSAVMWRLMFQDQVGVVNWLANDVLGVIAQPILSDRTLLLIAAIGVDVWKTTPFMALLLLAGLLTIPEDVYEAARVDGANVFQRFFSITMPLLKPALLVALLFRTLESYRVFDLFWGMSNRELESLSTFVYEGVKISQLQFAQGNAAAVFIFVTAFLLALVFIKVFGMQTSTED
ncbi:carbohydrate ABC transporter permease [Rubrobacter indicoceani]|uniref:carbohydrate ABC transporter permease n=1 Tax=Rubrobacter indicoceani TaxID=2051957 RepID=UPI000E5C38A5|nr:sugar ABC transporter permease [Rubrobacter indicoceani]